MQATLISVDNALDYLGIYDRLGSNQHSLLHSIVRIFNLNQFPESLIIANVSLQVKAGIKPSNFHRTRQALLDFFVDDQDSDSWILKYEPNREQQAGRYRINYDFLQHTFNVTSTDLQSNINLTSTDLQSNINLTSTDLQSNINIPSLYLHDTFAPQHKMAKNGNDHRIDRIEKTRSEKTRSEKTRPDQIVPSSQILSKKDDHDLEKVLVGFSYKGISEGELRKIKEYYADNKVELIQKYFPDIIGAIKEWEKTNGY